MPTPPPAREEDIFAAAQELSAAERGPYLDRACENDAALRARIEELLSADAGPEGFLSSPPAEELAAAVQQCAPENAGPAAGERIGRYKLLQKIGDGGCGVVYLAEQVEPVRRRVALKIIKLGMDTKEVIARFEAERQALALMDHPHIAKVLDAGATETGRPYFVMELVRGIPITKFCDEQNLPARLRLELFAQVCQAVEHAHQNGIIHRDIKPSNILVTLNDEKPVPKIIDFGIAKATQGRLTEKTVFTAFTQLIGTPAYMSPEQAEMSGLEIDVRSDIYSLGVLLYELLTGRTPFDTSALLEAGLDEIRRIIREVDPPVPSTRLNTLSDLDRATVARRLGVAAAKLSTLLKGDLDWIVMRCLEKDRLRRYESASGLALDVIRHLRDEPVTAGPPGTWYRLRKFARRNRRQVVGATAVLAAAAAGLAAAQWLPSAADKAAALAGECHVFRVDIDAASGRSTGRPIQLTNESIVRRQPVGISPDGKQLAYWYQHPSKAGLAVMSSTGGNPRHVSDENGVGPIVWHGPDEVLFQRSSPGLPRALVSLHLKTGAVRPFFAGDLSASGHEWHYVPSRGEIIYVSDRVSPEGRSFKAHSLGTGTTRTLATIPNLLTFRNTFQVSPDGRHIAYGRWVDVGGQRVAEMRLRSIEGGEEKVLLPAGDESHEGWRPSGYPYAWAPHGRHVLYDRRGAAIQVLEIATGATWPINGAEDDAIYEWGVVTWSPEGSFLALTRYRK